jgi:hypothetical protein
MNNPHQKNPKQTIKAEQHARGPREVIINVVDFKVHIDIPRVPLILDMLYNKIWVRIASPRVS